MPQPDQPITRADLDAAVVTVIREISRRAEESQARHAATTQALDLIGNALQSVQTSTALHTRILTQRGQDQASDRTEVSRLRADLDAAMARIAALEQRQGL